MKFFENFDRIYCINLGHRKDRWESCLRQFQAFGISKGVIRYEPEISQLSGLSKKANAQISCAISHYKIVTEALAQDCKHVLVLEDDFSFSEKYEWAEKKLNDSWHDLPKDWDIFYLGAYFVQGYDFPPALPYSQNLARVQTGFCTHAMAYSQGGMKKVTSKLKITSELEIREFSREFESFDWFLVRDIQMHSSCFTPRELLCIQSAGYSDIEDQYHNYPTLFRLSHQAHIMGKGSLDLKA